MSRKPPILMIDNYDSFTFNLVQLLRELGAHVVVQRNDEITPAQALELSPTHLVISPGPGGPREAGVSMAMIEALGGRIPVLGVCLGHQAIAEVYGGRVVRAGRLMHGKESQVLHDGRGLFEGLPSPCPAGRYHSLVVEPESLPPRLEVTARTAEGEIMGLRVVNIGGGGVEGVQFHPESVLTPEGRTLLANFLRRGKEAP
jgi:anthranilate synthase/aminodeoxychorismate synthase-like glutamine amidotransferase